MKKNNIFLMTLPLFEVCNGDSVNDAYLIKENRPYLNGIWKYMLQLERSYHQVRVKKLFY